MANRRMIASDIWSDEWFGQLDYFDQALWIGLFSTCADDQGRLLDNAMLIRAAVFPYKNVAPENIETLLSAFAATGRLIRYESDGHRLIQIVNWWEHQQPAWADPSKWPAPPGWIDRVRTRRNGRFVTQNWTPCVPSGTPSSEPVGVSTVQEQSTPCGEPSGAPCGRPCGEPSGRQSPVPVPVPVPVPIPLSDSVSMCVGGNTRETTQKRPPPTPKTPARPVELCQKSKTYGDIDGKTHPAIMAFREVTKYTPAPNGEPWKAICDGVDVDDKNIQRWTEAITAWVNCGNSVRNVSGMLDWYDSGKRDNRQTAPEKRRDRDRKDTEHTWYTPEEAARFIHR